MFERVALFNGADVRYFNVTIYVETILRSKLDKYILEVSPKQPIGEA